MAAALVLSGCWKFRPSQLVLPSALLVCYLSSLSLNPSGFLQFQWPLFKGSVGNVLFVRPKS